MEETLVFSLRAETGRQSLFNDALGGTHFSPLCVSVNDHKIPAKYLFGGDE